MNKILFATDFSETCQNALNFLIKMLEGRDIKIDIIHVFDLPVTTLTSLPQDISENILHEKKLVLNKQLKEEMEHVPRSLRGDIHLVYGEYPSSDLADTAQQIDADLIVMALRQKYSLIDRMMATITAHTIAKSSVPVLAIPNGAQFSGIDKILFPSSMSNATDLLPGEEKALEWLFDFWCMQDCPQIEMVHISKDGGVDIEFLHKPLPTMKFKLSHAKSVDSGILKFLENEDVDLIAFYKQNRSFWERLYHSSLTRKLLFQSRIPLLVFS